MYFENRQFCIEDGGLWLGMTDRLSKQPLDSERGLIIHERAKLTIILGKFICSNFCIFRSLTF